jgi:redox-sensitive bicupin YhaK (pirin superfamily)
MMDRREVIVGAAAAATAGFLLPLGEAAAEGAPRARLGVRRSNERGRFDHGWLDTYHTFSFASYHDPRWMGFRSLRVINEDVVQPGQGFGMHPHKDMEIITYVLRGALEHKDSLGNGGVIVPGEVQRMSAGTGIHHSEFNPSREQPVHLLQIWLLPDRRGVKPGYGQKTFGIADRPGTLTLVASKGGRQGSIPIHQDANVHAGVLKAGEPLTWQSPAGRHVWLQVARGSLAANGTALRQGDGAWTSEAGAIELRAGPDAAEIVLFDLS